MALWGGRFTQGPDQRFKDYNDSLKFDYRMALEDIEGSICWADAIYKAGVLTEQENKDLKKALAELHDEVSKDIDSIATAGDVPEMAAAFKLAIEAGRKAYLTGMGRVLARGGSASDPLTGFLR